MKKLLVLLVLVTTKVNAFPVPDYLVDGVITVTTKTGETYVYSSNEYKVVKRTKKEIKKEQEQVIVKNTPIKEERKKHIISGYAIRSQQGLESSVVGLNGEVKTKYDLGAGFIYQYRFSDSLYIGGGFDTNGGKLLMLGTEF